MKMNFCGLWRATVPLAGKNKVNFTRKNKTIQKSKRRSKLDLKIKH